MIRIHEDKEGIVTLFIDEQLVHTSEKSYENIFISSEEPTVTLSGVSISINGILNKLLLQLKS